MPSPDLEPIPPVAETIIDTLKECPLPSIRALGYSLPEGKLVVAWVDTQKIERFRRWDKIYPNPTLEVFCIDELEAFGSRHPWLPKISWWDRHKGTVGLIGGIIIGVGVTIAIANAVN